MSLQNKMSRSLYAFSASHLQCPLIAKSTKVQYCAKNNIKFLAQNGGHSWVITFNIGPGDLVINLRLLSQVTFNGDKSQVTYGGGALISDIVTAAYANGVQVPTGNCNCVGTLGAILGGGFGRLMGLYGMGVDNLLSVNLVTADGRLQKVDASNADLWWALRGAGPNFGIVTSATMNSYPVPATTNGAYTGSLVFTNDKIEALVVALNNLVLEPPMAIFLYFANQGQPAVVAIPFYAGGTVDQYKSAFASIYAVGPIVDTSSFVAYNHLNDGSDSFCVKGMRKPSYGAGLNQMDPKAWRAVFNEYVKFLQNPGTQMSAVLMEYYSLQKAQTLPDSSSSYPFRHTVKFNALVIPWYSDPALDPVAEQFASTVRDLWRSTDNVAVNSTYVSELFFYRLFPPDFSLLRSKISSPLTLLTATSISPLATNRSKRYTARTSPDCKKSRRNTILQDNSTSSSLFPKVNRKRGRSGRWAGFHFFD